MSNIKLTLEQADRVREVWGIFLEFTNGTLLRVFLGAIPESFLPYPKPVIEQALKLLEDHFTKNGQIEAAKAMASASSSLVLYSPDSKALDATAKSLANIQSLDSIKENISTSQNRSLEYLLKHY